MSLHFPCSELHRNDSLGSAMQSNNVCVHVDQGRLFPFCSRHCLVHVSQLVSKKVITRIIAYKFHCMKQKLY